MASKVILYIRNIILTGLCACVVLDACKENVEHNSVKKRRHVFSFNNSSYLLVKSFIETNQHDRELYKLSEDSLLALIHNVYPKCNGKQIDDTILLHTYNQQLSNSNCGNINDMSLWRNSNTPKILSLNEKAIMDTLKRYFNKNLEQGFSSNSIRIDKLNIVILVDMFYCIIKELTITTSPRVDEDILNEFYRIVYTNPKWTLQELSATKAEVDSNDYVRDKKLKINLEIVNNRVTSIQCISDSLSK